MIELIPRQMNITPYNKNAKKHPDKQLRQIADSIKEFGWQQPIVVDKDNIIIVGHGRWFAWQKYGKELGLKEPEIKTADLTKEQASAYRLADNKLNESDWDMNLAIEDLKELDDDLFDLTGFDKDLLIEPDEKDDEIPEDAPPVAKLGDIWQLGKHRIMCGDSTKKEDVEKLMDGIKADMVFTDPPYNIGYDYWDYLDNKEAGEYKEWCEKWFRQLTKLSSVVLLTIGQWNMKMWFDIEKPLGIISWIAKNKTSGSKIAYFSIWEPILVYAKKIKDRRSVDFIANDVVRDDLSLISDVEQAKQFIKENSDIIEVNNQRQKGVGSHKCPKQVRMLTELFSRYSKVDDLLLDIFLGSGSTLIACEKTNRICYGMEIDPKYVDVIIKRYEDYSGNKAKKL